MSKVILSCLILLLSGCISMQKTHSRYVVENITPTCAYSALEDMDSITNVWLSYNYLPPFPTISRANLVGQEGIEFAGEGFFGFVSIRDDHWKSPRSFTLQVYVYSDDSFLYRHFAIWGPRERLLRIERIKEQIKEVLTDRCN